MKRILVGLDRSANAASALRWSAALARATHAEVLVVSAWTPQQAELPPEEWEREHRDRRAFLDASLATVRDDTTSIVGEVVNGAPVDVLLERAHADEASLLVAGLRGEGGFPRLLVGSVADTLAHHTTVPLALVPEGARGRVRRILLAVDGSEGASAAVRWSADFAPACDAEVVAAFVYPPPARASSAHDEADYRAQMHAEMHDVWLEPMRDAGVAPREEIVADPHVAEGLLTLADRTGADLIVAGTHGMLPMVHLRLGGVAMRLLHATGIPVVLVPIQ